MSNSIQRAKDAKNNRISAVVAAGAVLVSSAAVLLYSNQERMDFKSTDEHMATITARYKPEQNKTATTLNALIIGGAIVNGTCEVDFKMHAPSSYKFDIELDLAGFLNKTYKEYKDYVLPRGVDQVRDLCLTAAVNSFRESRRKTDANGVHIRIDATDEGYIYMFKDSEGEALHKELSDLNDLKRSE
jgi:hypothetical protein